MTDTPETTNVPTTEESATVAPSPPRPHVEHRPSRLYQTLAWVGAISGVLFVLTVVFVAGFFAGAGPGGYHGWTRGYHSYQMGPHGPRDGCPMMGPGGMMGPGSMMGPGGMMGPGPMMGPGGMGPAPTTLPPSPQRPS